MHDQAPVQDTLLVEGLTQQEQADSQLELVRDGYERVIIRPLKAGAQGPGELVLLADLGLRVQGLGCKPSRHGWSPHRAWRRQTYPPPPLLGLRPISRRACWGPAQHTSSCAVLALRTARPGSQARKLRMQWWQTALSCGQLIPASCGGHAKRP